MSALFPDLAAAVAALRTDQLKMAGSLLGGKFAPSDDYIQSKLVAAEREASRRLRVAFEPVAVFAGTPSEAELAALPEGTPWVEEEAYDFEPGLWTAEDWGYLVLRKSPVVSLSSMTFRYPTPTSALFEVPAGWIKIDKKVGHVRVVPSSSALNAGIVSMSLMHLFSSGRVIPAMIHLRYVAGLSNVAQEWPDLVNLVKKMAILLMIDDAYLPQSGSLSVDGLSQSRSVDVAKYHATVDAGLGALMQALHGVRMMVL